MKYTVYPKRPYFGGEMKARDIRKMSVDEQLKTWPEYRNWAMQLFREEKPVRDVCECGVVLDATYPTDELEFLERVKHGFGPMVNPVCWECNNAKPVGKE